MAGCNRAASGASTLALFARVIATAGKGTLTADREKKIPIMRRKSSGIFV